MAGLALASALLGASAPAALANSTLTISATPTVQITAAAGKANDMRITLNGASLTVVDPGDPIDAPLPCTGSGTTTVICNLASPIQGLSADVGDQNDRLRGDTTASMALSGGDGSDEVTVAAIPGVPDPGTNVDGDDPGGNPAGDGDDLLTGGDFGDFIEGGGGRDTLIGGGANDTLRPGPGTGDSVDGGPGDDFARWALGGASGQTFAGGPGVDIIDVRGIEFGPPFDTAISVNLVSGELRQTGGGAESATAREFEDADAAGATVTIVGTDGPNELFTSEGDDNVTGGAGADRLFVFDGADSVFVRDGFGDRVRCGRGTDTVEADQFDELYDCENVARVAVLPAGVERVAPVCTVRGLPRRLTRKRFLRRLRPSVGCNEAAALEARLSVRVRNRRGRLVTARAGDLVLAERELPLAAGRRRVSLKVPRALQRVLGRRFSARLTVVARDRFGNESRSTRTVRVR